MKSLPPTALAASLAIVSSCTQHSNIDRIHGEGLPIAAATAAVMVEDFAFGENLNLATYAGQNFAVNKIDGACPDPLSWQNPETGALEADLLPRELMLVDEHLPRNPTARQLEDAENNRAILNNHGLPSAFTDKPALVGHSRYDSRSYECHRSGDQAFVQYAPGIRDGEPRIDDGNRGCSFSDNRCMDACALQGRHFAEEGWAYTTELCFGIFPVFTSWWRPDYVCGGDWSGGEFESIEREDVPDSGVSECYGFMLPHYDWRKDEFTTPNWVLVATVGDSFAESTGEGQEVVRFSVQKVEGTGDFVPEYAERVYAGKLRRNWIVNAQGDVLLESRDEDGTPTGRFFGEPDKIGSNLVGYQRAQIVKKYGKHGKWIAETDKLDSWPLANSEFPSYLDGFYFDGQFVDILDQQLQILHPASF
jgi:hypothetical protein